jgi:hypothetical protein
MTPEEWDRCADPQDMLRSVKGKVSDRKLRLAAVGLARGVEHLAGDERSRRALEVAERYAECRATEEELAGARQAALAAAPGLEYGGRNHPRGDAGWGAYGARRAALATTAGSPLEAAWWAAGESCLAVAPRLIYYERTGLNDAQRAAKKAITEPVARGQAALVRCIVGNPYRPPPVIDRAVLAYNGGAVRLLAEVIYDGRRFDDLPVLADLLEEAGLSDAAILGHLRGPGPHGLGCWAVDRLLDRA